MREGITNDKVIDYLTSNRYKQIRRILENLRIANRDMEIIQMYECSKIIRKIINNCENFNILNKIKINKNNYNMVSDPNKEINSIGQAYTDTFLKKQADLLNLFFKTSKIDMLKINFDCLSYCLRNDQMCFKTIYLSPQLNNDFKDILSILKEYVIVGDDRWRGRRIHFLSAEDNQLISDIDVNIFSIVEDLKRLSCISELSDDITADTFLTDKYVSDLNEYMSNLFEKLNKLEITEEDKEEVDK